MSSSPHAKAESVAELANYVNSNSAADGKSALIAPAPVTTKPRGSSNAQDIEQLARFAQRGSVWNVCKEGTVEQIRHKFEVELPETKQEFNVLKERGTFGETILHVSMLFHNYEVSKYLVQRFPELIDEIYAEPLYEGETALHMAIANRSLEMAEFLLQHKSNQNQHRATGIFFKHNGGTVYYGEYPITFAIATKQMEMIRLLHEYGADLSVTDDINNSVFHHAVQIDSPQIFDLLMELAKKTNKSFDIAEVRKLKNNEQLSPMQYAVKLGKIKIFEHILEKIKIVGWEWGDVSFFAYPLTDIDTFGEDNPNSVLETLIIEQQSHFLLNPLLFAVLDAKWQSYGKYVFEIWFMFHLVYCGIITTIFLRFPFETTDFDYSWEIFLGFGLMEVKVLCLIVIELREYLSLIKEHGYLRAWHIYFQKKTPEITLSVSATFKILSYIANILSIIGGLCFIIQSLKILRATMVFILLVEWLFVMSFAQATRNTGRLVVTIFTVMVKDIARFVFIYMIILCAFASPMALLSNDATAVTTMGSSMFTLYEISLGVGEFFGDDFSENESDVFLLRILFILFLLISVVTLFNLLIAIITETTEEIGQQAHERWLLQWAQTVLLVERRVPRCLYKRTGNPGSEFGFDEKNKNVFFLTFTQTKDNDKDDDDEEEEDEIAGDKRRSTLRKRGHLRVGTATLATDGLRSKSNSSDEVP